MRRRTVLMVAAVSVVAGCSGSGDEATPRPAAEVDAAPETVSVSVTGERLEGRFLAVLGGETSNDNRLYELTFDPPEARLSTEARRVSSVGACAERVVVAAGQPEVGYSDQL
ncbi:MAG TPA: hypothetical protein VI854_05450, partial [Acidimicrobiia bacterium]|nr:hypothetical protein [Acidimicrobiia bacterium]